MGLGNKKKNNQTTSSSSLASRRLNEAAPAEVDQRGLAWALEDVAAPSAQRKKQKESTSKKGKRAEADEAPAKKQKKDPNLPKTARSAFTFFSIDERKSPDVSALSFGEQGKAISLSWKAISAADRKPYDEMNKEDVARYARDVEAYEAEHGPLPKPERKQKEPKEPAASKSDASKSEVVRKSKARGGSSSLASIAEEDEGASDPPRPAKKIRRRGERKEKPPLSPGSVNRWNAIDPQFLDPNHAKQFILMYEQHVEGLRAKQPPSAPAGSSGEAASSSPPEPAEPSPPAPSPSEPSLPEPSPPKPATDAWLPARSYENTEDAITDRVISLMREAKGAFTLFTMGMKDKTDVAGGLAAHRAMREQLQHEASKLPGGLNDATFAAVCSATLAHADARHTINAGSRAEYTTVDEAAEPQQVPAPLFSQTIHVTLEYCAEDVVRLGRGGGGRAFSQQELEVVLNDPKLPPCTKALVELATASTIPDWHAWTLAVTRNQPCLMKQWRVVDGPAVAPVQAEVEFPSRGITGAQEAEVFRAPSTVKGRLGVQAAYFHVLGFKWQFCCLPIFALVRFGVVLGNPQHGGDAHVIAIDRHGEVINQQSEAGVLGGGATPAHPAPPRPARRAFSRRARPWHTGPPPPLLSVSSLPVALQRQASCSMCRRTKRSVTATSRPSCALKSRRACGSASSSGRCRTRRQWSWWRCTCCVTISSWAAARRRATFRPSYWPTSSRPRAARVR